MTPVLLVPPTSEPISLADAKAWLRIDTDYEDSAIAALVPAARALLEAATRRFFMTQTWRLSLDAEPRCPGSSLSAFGIISGIWAIPLAPVASIAVLRVYDAAGVPQTIDPATYRLFDAPDAARIVFSTPPPVPGRALAGIEIDVVVGYGAAADVPLPLRQAMLMLVARWFENRGDTATNDRTGLPDSVAQLVAPFRRRRLV